MTDGYDVRAPHAAIAARRSGVPGRGRYFADLEQKYGLTERLYYTLVDAQGNRCAICGTHASATKRMRLVVDHCHETGLIRGLLCDPCNKGLGCFRDKPKWLRAAIDYLGSEYEDGD